MVWKRFRKNQDFQELENITVGSDKPGSVIFNGSEIAELYTKEIAESFAGVLRKNYVANASGDFPAGFVHASPPGQYWSGTFWTRDGGTFLRELVLWGYFNHAKVMCNYLMQAVVKNPEGFFMFPMYFSGKEKSAGTELDGSAAIVIGMVLFWQRLDVDDPFRQKIYDFLHNQSSPVSYFHKVLKNKPLLAGSGEFGGGCSIEGLYCNVVQNHLVYFALLAVSGMERAVGEEKTAVLLENDAQKLRQNIDRHLINEKGEWIWCVIPKTLKADPEILNHFYNKGFGGLNGPSCMAADVLGMDAFATGLINTEACRKTFDNLYAVPARKYQFDKYGIWTQFDIWTNGLSSSPAYGQGYAIQTMLLLDRFDMAEKGLEWIAKATYRPIDAYRVPRDSPYHFYERTYSPDAEGVISLDVGCGALNLVNVTEQLKVARMIIGIDDWSSPDEVKFVPRLPPSWTSFEIRNWPIRIGTRVVRVDIIHTELNPGASISRISVHGGEKIPRLVARFALNDGFKNYVYTNVKEHTIINVRY